MPGKLHRPGDLITPRYEIVDYLDEGGMQEVYSARDLTLQRLVALKVPKNMSAKKRFQRSAEMSAKVNHPNVAKTLDLLEYKGTDYLIEQLIEGHDLGSRLKTEFDRLDPHLAAHVIHHVAKGVAASHHVGVFHRDLKPSNIIVSDDPGLAIVKLTDFGIAKMAEEEIGQSIRGGNDSITASKTVVGALPYMAPELIETSEAALPADIWAVGALLYHLLAGAPPFGTGLLAVQKIMGGKFPAQDEVVLKQPHFAALMTALWSIITDCLQKDPAKRPTADQLSERLSELSYSVAPRQAGEIVRYAHGTGDWGFISGDEGGEFFFHAESFYGVGPSVGTRVNFAVFDGRPRPRAFPVLPLKEANS